MDHSVKDMEKTPLSIPDNIRDGSRRHLWKRLWRQSPKVVVKDWDFLPVSEFAEDQPPGNISNKALIDAKLYSSQLHRWLGLTFFLLLRPLAMDRFGQEGEVRNYSSDILLPGQIPTSQDFDHHKMLLSSFHIALQNTGCCIPAFVQLGHSSKIIVHGIGFLQGDKGFNFVNMPSITPYGSGYHFSNYTKHTGYASQDPTDVISSAYLYRFKTYLIRHGSLHKNSQALSRFFTAQMSRDIFLESDTYVVEKNLIDGITVAELSTYDAPFGPKSEWEMKNFTSPGSRNDRAKPLGFTEDPVTFIRLQLYASSQLVDSPTDVSDWTVTVQYRHEVYKLPMLADSLNEILRDWLPQLCDNDGDLLDEDQRQLDGSNETLEKTLSRTDSGETTTLRAMHIGRKAVLSWALKHET
ncbi:hypothetical protein BC829DRAFT_100666 [Chytridium lagenaria]|nr:hypothetical protein BC829DRAFT_100666 [Chytridium lagenaria]